MSIKNCQKIPKTVLVFSGRIFRTCVIIYRSQGITYRTFPTYQVYVMHKLGTFVLLNIDLYSSISIHILYTIYLYYLRC